MSHDPVIEPAAVPLLGVYRLLDVRSPDAFDSGHAAHAMRVPIEEWEAAAKAGETSFENVTYWEHQIAALGVDGQRPVVIYDDGRMTEAARVWFILQYFGAKAFILNGGWPALEGGALLPVSAAKPRDSTTFRARPGSGPVGLADRTTLKAELGADVRVFDARTVGEYTGTDLRRNARGGHLPGARLIPHSDLLDDGRLKPAGHLRGLLADAGFQSGDHIVTHCDGGGRAALAAVAAVRAGCDDVRVYYLSFSDWAKDGSCPIVG
ncbi:MULTISPECIES: sulfurtransferase [Hyphomicrobium]|jgi:thiosulfate/3-mercaptopyruvate sulfurtransferase|uniref:sulfurtransferase n=1 Tax=Hyphomicrobium TaxID=81 RepID=UPI00037BB268|nr:MULTISPECIES: rhodanese-like domain-containing protein [Hyphomicrobium]WBT38788.1 rhodanese-like domain-containing protein [Hyphomicrobium sp. DMF-1]